MPTETRRGHRFMELLYHHEASIVAVLLCLGCILRLAGLSRLPYGLNQDEASSGYEAFALLCSGIDRNGSQWPPLFVSWGSGQNVLMSYLALPWVALLGPTETAIRLPNAISGCLTLAVFWLLARYNRGTGFGLCALFVLTVNPWHIMASRWALESNLLPLFLLSGCLLTSLAKTRPWCLTGAAACFGLSLYAYGAAFFFLPLYLVLALLWLRKELRWSVFLVSISLFLCIAFPITLCQIRNALDMEETQFLWMTLPKLTQGRQAATSVFGGGWRSVPENLGEFLKILWTQSDGLPYNALGVAQGGIFYVFGLPFAIAGGVCAFAPGEKLDSEGPLRFALVSGLVCTLLIRCNVNRINMLWLPLIYCSALGLHLVLEPLGRRMLLPLSGVLACFLVFFSAYQGIFGGNGNGTYFPGLGAAIEYAASLDAETVYITNYVNQPYIFALLYSKTMPEEFRNSVVYWDPNAPFRQVERFTGYAFDRRDNCAIWILHKVEARENQVLQVLAVFGDYVVCRGNTDRTQFQEAE